MTGLGKQGKTSVLMVLELYDAMRDGRIRDMLALVDPKVTCGPLLRPGLTLYQGHLGIARLASNLHAAHGDYRVEIVQVTERPGPQVAVLAWIVPGPRHGRPVLVHSVFLLHDGLITAIESFTGNDDAVRPPRVAG